MMNRQQRPNYTTAGGQWLVAKDPISQKIFFADKVFDLLWSWFKNMLVVFGITSATCVSVYVVYILLAWLGVV